MITRTEAERIAQSINVIRHDWPVPSLLTLIERDLADWPLLDIYVGLAHVAIERNLDGTWTTRSPARVKENGPWRRIEGLAGDVEQQRQQADAEHQQRLEDIRVRTAAAAACTWCDPQGRLENGHTCPHDQPPQWRAQRAQTRAAEARAAIRPAPRPNQPATEGAA